MQIGLALPTMADGWRRDTYLDWCRIIDEGPFSSISCGERITFRNVEMLTTLAAAAALTSRPRVFVNLAIAPWHSATLLAKQLATLDVLSAGRLDVGLGVGGREQDYAAVGSPYAHRHRRLDEQVAELRRLWAGSPPVPEAPPLGPLVVQPGGPALYAGATGPKSLRRAAAWAAGVSGFSFSLDVDEVNAAIAAAREAWSDAGVEHHPRFVVGCFYVLGRNAEAELRQFTHDYLEVFGERFARHVAGQAELHSPDRLRAALERLAEQTAVDEVILVPGSVDPDCATGAAAVITGM